MTFYLQRFLNAQDFGNVEYGTESYATALQEIKDGHKKTHWMWYVFPQMKGLGKSEMSSFYGINGREEAIAQYQRNKAKLQELNGSAIRGNSLTSKED